MTPQRTTQQSVFNEDSCRIRREETDWSEHGEEDNPKAIPMSRDITSEIELSYDAPKRHDSLVPEAMNSNEKEGLPILNFSSTDNQIRSGTENCEREIVPVVNVSEQDDPCVTTILGNDEDVEPVLKSPQDYLPQKDGTLSGDEVVTLAVLKPLSENDDNLHQAILSSDEETRPVLKPMDGDLDHQRRERTNSCDDGDEVNISDELCEENARLLDEPAVICDEDNMRKPKLSDDDTLAVLDIGDDISDDLLLLSSFPGNNEITSKRAAAKDSRNLETFDGDERQMITEKVAKRSTAKKRATKRVYDSDVEPDSTPDEEEEESEEECLSYKRRKLSEEMSAEDIRAVLLQNMKAAEEERSSLNTNSPESNVAADVTSDCRSVVICSSESSETVLPHQRINDSRTINFESDVLKITVRRDLPNANTSTSKTIVSVAEKYKMIEVVLASDVIASRAGKMSFADMALSATKAAMATSDTKIRDVKKRESLTQIGGQPSPKSTTLLPGDVTLPHMPPPGDGLFNDERNFCEIEDGELYSPMSSGESEIGAPPGGWLTIGGNASENVRRPSVNNIKYLSLKRLDTTERPTVDVKKRKTDELQPFVDVVRNSSIDAGKQATIESGDESSVDYQRRRKKKVKKNKKKTYESDRRRKERKHHRRDVKERAEEENYCNMENYEHVSVSHRTEEVTDIGYVSYIRNY